MRARPASFPGVNFSRRAPRTYSFATVAWFVAAMAGVLPAQGAWKVNVASALVGVPQVAWERPLGGLRTLQVDLVVSPWRSVDHAPMQFAVLTGEWRHHYREVGAGPYVGWHVGLAGFRLQKWEYRDTEFYQEGFGVVGGATVGYEWRVGKRTTLDLFAGGGTAQSKYKGYSYLTGDRYDGEQGWNESGEWLVYRTGVMISRKAR